MRFHVRGSGIARVVLVLGLIGNSLAAEKSPTERLLSSVLWDLNGKAISLESLKGKQVLVNFYASWCSGCREEVKDINQLKNDMRGKVEVVGISLDTDTKAARDFGIATEMIYFSLLSGSLGTGMMAALGNEKRGLPYTIMIDKTGEIKFAKLGTLKGKDLIEIKKLAQ